MFDLNLGILRTLHEEHVAMLAVLERLEALLASNGAKNPPDTSQAETASLLADVATTLGGDVSHHYDFEENHLFSRFAEMADPGISKMLCQEHKVIRPLAERLTALIEDARKNGFGPDSWAEFHAKAGEIVEREIFHIQKEEMGFLPALDQILEEDEDGPLQMTYVEMKGG